MQHPVGYSLGSNGSYQLASYWALLLNPWALWQYCHTMLGAVQAGSFMMAAVGAFYLLSGRHLDYARIFVRLAVIVGLIAALLQLFPTGDRQGVMVAKNQPVTLAAMEGVFKTQQGAPLAILGQPDVDARRLDNPLVIPNALSFLTYRVWTAEVRGLEDFPQDVWPDQIPLVYFSYHIMVGLGTIFIAVLALAALLLYRGSLFQSRGMLWVLMLALPFPFIANTAGWITAEVGRQPWLIYGLMRTRSGVSPTVASGNVWFTLIGFMGLYTVLTILYLFLVSREIENGPELPPDNGIQVAATANR
jgi:cytochrome d ubiquinol oxidase subunit I